MPSTSKPPFAYFGGKTILAPRIAAALPAHRHYVEPFAGSLAVLLAKAPSQMETVNDLDGAIVNFWRVLRDRPADLSRACQMTPHSRAEFENSQALDVDDELERARLLWVRLTQSRSGRLRRVGWRHYINPGAVGYPFPSYLDGYVDRMAAALERLHHVSLECRPALEIVQRYGACADVCLYVDPPYLGSTRPGGPSYRHELLTDDEHRELGETLRACKAAVVLSGYPSDLYDRELYPDWHRTTFQAGTGQGSDGWSNRTEVLWSNRPFVDEDTLMGSIFDEIA
jgi:DNA adenine methylase